MHYRCCMLSEHGAGSGEAVVPAPRAAVRQAARVTAGAGVGRLGRRLAAGDVTAQGARAKAGTLRGRVRLPVGPRRLPRGFHSTRRDAASLQVARCGAWSLPSDDAQGRESQRD